MKIIVDESLQQCDETLEQYWERRDKQLEEDKKNYKGPHCCLIMDYNLDKSSNQNVSPCSYNPKFREYYLDTINGYGSEKINFCPYCGTKLPDGLSDLWFDILEKEYGFKSPTSIKQKEKIPVEFKTDEWWKKRGI